MSAPDDLPVRDSLVNMLEMLCDRFASPMSIAMASFISRAEWEDDARSFLDRLIDHAETEIRALIERGIAEEGLELDIPIESAPSIIAGPFFYERYVRGTVRSRDLVPSHVDALMARWTPAR